MLQETRRFFDYGTRLQNVHNISGIVLLAIFVTGRWEKRIFRKSLKSTQ